MWEIYHFSLGIADIEKNSNLLQWVRCISVILMQYHSPKNHVEHKDYQRKILAARDCPFYWEFKCHAPDELNHWFFYPIFFQGHQRGTYHSIRPKIPSQPWLISQRLSKFLQILQRPSTKRCIKIRNISGMFNSRRRSTTIPTQYYISSSNITRNKITFK